MNVLNQGEVKYLLAYFMAGADSAHRIYKANYAAASE